MSASIGVEMETDAQGRLKRHCLFLENSLHLYIFSGSEVVVVNLCLSYDIAQFRRHAVELGSRGSL
ncbi:hypothetical protein T11_8282 [Trichinella zimbabwensis]|uniref:Uncharacterized protein n=1 Tax=Trichinella zimbabwensis TaxID=268475 RepID=A0A0V1HIA5_9BILA|nr:hypothetical protein T11_8282 [Trichinella zimbabwensis]